VPILRERTRSQESRGVKGDVFSNKGETRLSEGGGKRICGKCGEEFPMFARLPENPFLGIR